jgi:hypothetical protein
VGFDVYLDDKILKIWKFQTIEEKFRTQPVNWISQKFRILLADIISRLGCCWTLHQPQQLVDGWKESQPPEEWLELKDAQLVNLGSGRFCIARFFRYYDFEDDCSLDFAVLTDVEVLPCVLNGNGKVKLEMIPHKSMCQTSVPNCRDFIGCVLMNKSGALLPNSLITMCGLRMILGLDS